jgi:hypothetical protein
MLKQEILTGETIASGGDSVRKNINMQAVSWFEIQVDGTALDLTKLTLRVKTDKLLICDDILFSDLQPIWEQQKGVAVASTQALFGVSFGNHFMSSQQEMEIYIAGTDATNDAIIDLVAYGVEDAPSNPITYTKRTDYNFAVENLHECWYVGSALDEVTTLITSDNGHKQESLSVLAHCMHTNLWRQGGTAQVTHAQVYNDDLMRDVTFFTQLSSGYFVNISTVYNQVESKRGQAIAQFNAKKKVQSLSQVNLEANVFAGSLSSKAYGVGGAGTNKRS